MGTKTVSMGWTRISRRVRLGLCAAMTSTLSCGPDEPNDTNPEIEIDEGEDPLVWVAGPVSQRDLEILRGQACLGSNSPAEPQPHTLQMVVDVSGSMGLVPETGTEVKWHTTREALREVVALLPETTHLGALYFPNKATERNCLNEEGPCMLGHAMDVSACVEEDGAFPLQQLGPAQSNARFDFEASLDAVNPAGGTPTHDAIKLALERLAESTAPGPRFLLLITDGQPTFSAGCVGSGNMLEPVDEQPVVDSIAEAFTTGLHTYVIGSPGSESHEGTGEDARPWLSRASIAGGTALDECKEEGPDYCHFDLSVEQDFESGLVDALDRILGQIASCEFSIPEAPDGKSVDPSIVNVIMHHANGQAEIIGRAEDDDCVEGWSMDAAERSLHLCPQACERLRTSAGWSIELLFGCEAAPIRPPK